MRWRANRVYWAKEALLPRMGARDGLLVSESGNPELRCFHCWSGDVEVDVRSPLAQEAFHAMPLAEQVHFLRMWNPATPSWDGPVREGLAATLQAAVTSQPVSFFEHADQFAELDPVYATALARGLSEGLEGKTISNWKPFWAFASWVLTQPDPEIGIRDEFSGETGLGRRWQNCRLEIARLLDAALNGELAPLPLAERACVWHLIDVLTRDPNPAPVDEVSEDERVMDPFAMSLNTVRGMAVHAVFSFVFWIRSHAPRSDQGARNLDDVPEARAALEALLDPQLETSLTIRSVFGANLTRLTYWAEAWLSDHLEQIFPEQGLNEQCEIAWQTFIRFSRVDAKTLALLRQQYSAAIATMSQDAVAGPRHLDSRVNLGQNLVMSYCRGVFDFQHPGNLLAAFFTRAPEAARGKVMAFVGRALAQPNGPLPIEMFARLLKLWNWLVQSETPSGGPGFQDKAA